MFVIGSVLAANEAVETLKGKYGEFSLPITLAVENLMPMAIVDGATGLYLDSNIAENGVAKGEFTFPTFGHLMKFVTDMEVVARLNGYKRAVILSDITNDEAIRSETDTTDTDTADTVDAERTKETAPKRGRNKEKSEG
ncbi:hypothetical protein ACWIUH_01425 [Ursidibacter arcticus]